MPRCSAIAWTFASALLLVAPSTLAQDAVTPPETHAVQYEIAEMDLVAHKGNPPKVYVVPLGCRAVAMVQQDDQAFVTCGHDVIIVGAEPRPHIVVRKRLRSLLTGLRVDDKVVMAQIAGQNTWQPLDDLPMRSASLPPAVTASREFPPMSQDRIEATEPTRVGRFESSLFGTALAGVARAGAGALVEGSFVYRASAPFMVGAYGTFGAGSGGFDTGTQFTGPNGGDVQVVNGEIVVGVDARYVEVSAGAGVGLYRDGYEAAPVFAARGRFGRRDRFDFTWHFSVAAPPNKADVGVLGGAIQFRVTSGWWMSVDGEFGNMRYGHALLEIRHRLRGSGSHGTFDLQGGVGLSLVESRSLCDNSGFGSPPTAGTPVTCHGTNATYIGPAIRFGALWR